MEDQMLVARLRALWNYLDFVSDGLKSDTWRPKGEGIETRAEMGAAALWDGLEIDLINKIVLIQDRIEGIEKTISDPAKLTAAEMEKAWQAYGEIRKVSQIYIQECSEIIGSLAIRSNNLDHKILYVADELIRESLSQAVNERRYYLMIHGMDDTFTEARARIIRVRFSEWTIWDLPLAGHELGHVVVDMILKNESGADFPVLTPFVQKRRDQIMTQDPELEALNQQGGDDQKEAQDRAKGRLLELLADAFATYTMGPAYAYSAMLLRLNPPEPAAGRQPPDAQRAEMIVAMLGWMNNEVVASKPYTDIIGNLRVAWDAASDRIAKSVELSDEQKEWIQELAAELGSSIWPGSLLAAALYPPRGTHDGFLRALDWANEWQTQWKKGEPGQPENSSGKLRDVLNAAWICRWSLAQEYPAFKDQARVFKRQAEVAQELCETIIARKAKTEPEGPKPPGG